jgi:hypothetical protein
VPRRRGPAARCAALFPALLLAACAATASAPAGPVAVVASDGGPGAAFAQFSEERRRGIGIPPPLPSPGAIDRLPGLVRASQPAPATAPGAGASVGSPMPGRALSRLSALPASPWVNPPGASAQAWP